VPATSRICLHTRTVTPLVYVSPQFMKFCPLTHQIGQGKRSHGGVKNGIVVPACRKPAPKKGDVLFIRLRPRLVLPVNACSVAFCFHPRFVSSRTPNPKYWWSCGVVGGLLLGGSLLGNPPFGWITECVL